MELYFNELSLTDQGRTYSVAYADLYRLAEIYRELKQADIHVCRISEKDFTDLLSGVKNLGESAGIFSDLLFSFLQRPFESGISDEAEASYYESEWKCDGDRCLGLAIAYFQSSAALSIGKERWDSAYIDIASEKENLSVRNIYSCKQVSVHASWLESLKEIELLPCESEYYEKRINLRDDHGKDILEAFAKRLVRNRYVCEIVNSLPFSSHDRRFIQKIKDGGIIHIVLPWTDQGLGMAVKTTGRNRRETEKIAEILQEEYGRI